MSAPTPLARWHAVLAAGDPAALADVVADDAVFRSPIVYTPQRGKAATLFYLTAAFHVLVPNGFRYVREIVGERDAALEFLADIDGIEVNGVDLIRWNAAGLIEDFTVLVRPLKAIELLHRLMREQLAASAP
jgi:hypothetical protein